MYFCTDADLYRNGKWCFGVGNALFVLYGGRLRSTNAPMGGREDDGFIPSGVMMPAP